MTDSSADSVAGMIVHVVAGELLVEATIEEDNPTTRSCVAMLPMRLTFSDFGCKEKVATPPGEWDFTDAAGPAPEPGDQFSYLPWGNLGFFYNTDGVTDNDQVTQISSPEDIELIELLDGQAVTITAVK